jgi:4-hydroxythreonine-4-phosphate dehydrogenase
MNNAENQPPILGLTMGDPAGVGPELCGRAMRESSVLDACVPVLFGDAGVLKRLAQAGFAMPECRVVSLAEWEQLDRVQEPILVAKGRKTGVAST